MAGISRTGRAQRRRCLPHGPLGGSEVRQGAASVRARCHADGGPERGLAAQQPAGAVQPWRRISGCTDRSAGGCADRRTATTERARAAARRPPRAASNWQGRRGQLPGMAWAYRRGCHDASARACDEELSTRVGAKGAYQQVNSCCEGNLGGVLVREQAGAPFGASRQHTVMGDMGNAMSHVHS